MMKNRYATVWWTIDDIKDRRPEWTRKQCAAWLDNVEERLMRAMTYAGDNLIDFELKRED